MAVDVLWYYIEVTADEGWHLAFRPNLHLIVEAIHPLQFVNKLVASDRISVGKIDIGNANAADDNFEKSRMTVCFVAGKRCRDYVDGMARQDRNSVVCLLRNGGASVPKLFKELCRKLHRFQFLQQ